MTAITGGQSTIIVTANTTYLHIGIRSFNKILTHVDYVLNSIDDC